MANIKVDGSSSVATMVLFNPVYNEGDKVSFDIYFTETTTIWTFVESSNTTEIGAAGNCSAGWNHFEYNITVSGTKIRLASNIKTIYYVDNVEIK